MFISFPYKQYFLFFVDLFMYIISIFLTVFNIVYSICFKITIDFLSYTFYNNKRLFGGILI